MALTHALMLKRKGEQQSPLENALSATRLTWLAQYASTRRDSYYAALSGWRTKLERFEMQAEDNFSYRKKEGNRNAGRKSIFDVQNDSLNVIGAFCEFFTAQAKNDLFGSSPWFGAKPEGKKDHILADQITKHATWKLRHAEITPVYGEAVKLAAMLGTCFTKKTWMVTTDEYEEPITALQDAATGKPVFTSTGEPILAQDKIEGIDDETGQAPRFPAKDPKTDLSQGEYKYDKAFRKASRVTYRNVKATNLYYKDVSFDPMAPELDLRHTDFFHTFSKNLHDIIRDYDLSNEDAQRIYSNLNEGKTEARTPTGDRGEAYVSDPERDLQTGALPNIPVRLDEGYMRLDVTGKNKSVSNIYIVFCREIDLVLKVDYLANITPEGMLPVHCHTIEKVPFRIVGRGYFEHLELAQTIIDDDFNKIRWHDRKASQPIQGFDKSQLMQEDEEENEPFNDEKPVNLKPGAKLTDFLQFLELPDLSERTVEMMQMTLQMVQLRTGITSAAQGDMTGMPETNTATGIKQLMTRAAVLLKSSIDDLKRSFTKDLYYTVKLLYSNFDREETFTYGEGENTELIQITPEQVEGLNMDVDIILSQTQDMDKVNNSKAAIEFMNGYAALPEMEKVSQRQLYIQALAGLGFSNADKIVRPGVTSMQEMIPLLPPEEQQLITTALAMQEQAAAATPLPADSMADPMAPPVTETLSSPPL